ncbi:hypothetical protein H0H81_006187 [Sphagnurus paluster]|uniref:Uncharacterized protein n=1 Tax=Sphagnurus paluster TaxID=117069 RepID=A0A9P7FTV4_9AGAR|nr:hypothetical protein H0H81_006187 [Sphagnurus paluster]
MDAWIWAPLPVCVGNLTGDAQTVGAALGASAVHVNCAAGAAESVRSKKHRTVTLAELAASSSVPGKTKSAGMKHFESKNRSGATGSVLLAALRSKRAGTHSRYM